MSHTDWGMGLISTDQGIQTKELAAYLREERLRARDEFSPNLHLSRYKALVLAYRCHKCAINNVSAAVGVGEANF